MTQHHDPRPSLWMLGGSIAFALMGAFTHALGTRCDWLVVALVRAGVMFVAMVVLARLGGVPLVIWKPRTLWIRSLAGSFSLVCNFYALAKLPVADALTLSHTYPLWIVALSALVLRQPPTFREVLGVACGVLGVALIEQPRMGSNALAVSVALLAALATSVAMLGLHRLRGVDPRAIVAHFAGVACVVSLAGVVARPGTISAQLLDPITLALLLGVAATGSIGQLCLTHAYARGKPARLASVGLTQVIFALVFDVILWNRKLTPSILAGFFLVLAPSAWLMTLAGRKLAKPEPLDSSADMAFANEVPVEARPRM